jgi:hypothetical protein
MRPATAMSYYVREVQSGHHQGLEIWKITEDEAIRLGTNKRGIPDSFAGFAYILGCQLGFFAVLCDPRMIFRAIRGK